MSKLVLTSIKATKDADEKIEKKDGYYKIRLGAFNVFNESGIFYTFNADVKALLESSSDLMRRIREGYLKGEIGHPQLLPGMTMKQYINRLLKIDLKNVCVHIREIEIVETNEEPLAGHGKKVIVWGWVKPFGPGEKMLRDALEDDNMNVAFSIRSIANDEVVDGITIRTVRIIVTWDYVTEPGVKGSSKWKSIGIEDRDLATIDLEDDEEVEEICNSLECKLGCGLESDDKLLKDTIKLFKENKQVNDVINEW